ncbi:hypothetical protein QWY82_16375 [Simiduia curdlanivorans]|uniref:Uncharacterized protein n=1 Tax=Simiduia curdlanivorans TaxID=1492769 RepID=A0ABV8UYJ2_9GAMM|nr:hypothetical protein [Simiduia curdlanivorans]MDN3640372.1 hypothetical protein [Simiduia curdlanivorans]
MHLGEVVGYKIRNIDYSLLKQFVLSMLWRASISDSYYYKKVKLGPLENKVKELVWNKDIGSVDEFSFVLAKFQDTGTVSKTMLDPHQERWWGRRYYRFYLSGYVLYVKADSQKTPEEWAIFIPSNNELILISRGRIENSKEYPLLVKIAQNSG